jgi:nucleotide-binding universal stress UspA family protein
VALAVHRGADLTVFTAVDPLLAEAARARAGIDLAKTQVEPELREFVRSVVPEHAPWAPGIKFEVRVGKAPDVILEVARRQGPDLVVMGTQGLGGFRKWLLGSTTERVLRHTRTPVLAVPPSATGSVFIDPGGARLDLVRILVATDFSDASAAALQWGLTAARELSLPLVLAHVVQPVSVPPQWQPYVVETDEERIPQARAKLVALSQRCGTHTCEVVVSIGAPPDAIASIAEDHRAGLIVVGLASDLGPLAPRPGSIAYPILTQSRVPVLVVPVPTAELAS